MSARLIMVKLRSLKTKTDQKLVWYVPSQSAFQLKFRSAKVTLSV